MPVTWRADQPYNTLFTLPPALELETKVVLKQCVSARAALAELKQVVGLIPNPTMLINALPILEARASSEIENIVTTADRLFQYLSNESAADAATNEALRYRHALLEGFGSLETRPLSTGTAEAICTRVMGRDMSVRRVPGTALANTVPGAVIYTPPATEKLIRDLLANWERFLHDREELDPLVRMAAAHYQFEAIHPFTDGNGRTGRILNSLFLVEQKLLPLPVLYLSRYVIARRVRLLRTPARRDPRRRLARLVAVHPPSRRGDRDLDHREDRRHSTALDANRRVRTGSASQAPQSCADGRDLRTAISPDRRCRARRNRRTPGGCAAPEVTGIYRHPERA